MTPRRISLAILILAVSAFALQAGDWPMWRHDARRSGATDQKLPTKLHLQWMRQLPALENAWPDQAKMRFDTGYEPVVAGQRLFLGSSYHDTLTAYDTRSGRELWTFNADGPVRFAPAVWENRVYFASDDGYLYCVDCSTGKLVWKFRGGPTDRKVLGNERLISTWPARGAPVIADGTVYFAAGIWPFMGIFLHAIDARTGKAVWTTDGDGSMYMRQPHNTDAFAGVAPQGPLVVVEDRLLVPGGRSVPACYDRETGKFLYYFLAENGKRGGGSEVVADKDFFCNGGAIFHLETGQYLGAVGQRVVLSSDHLYSASANKCETFSLSSAKVELTEKVDRKGEKSRTAKWTINKVASGDLINNTAFIQAGARLYAGATGKLFALDAPTNETPHDIDWQTKIEGTPSSLVAADDRLFAVTLDGKLYCFGATEITPQTHDLPVKAAAVKDRWTEQAATLLTKWKPRDDYAIIWGAASGRLVTELAVQSKMRLLVIEPDDKKAQALRAHIRSLNLPRERVTVLAADPQTLALPPYLASYMTAETFPPAGMALNTETVGRVFQSLRPYGGSAWLPLTETSCKTLQEKIEKLPGAKLELQGDWTTLTREGALPGAANWSHEHADPANTRVSRDRIVKAPLGLLWFGGSSNDGVLPRHGHGPQPQVVDGQLFIEGIDMMRAMDIYTGRVLWETTLTGVGAYYNNLAHQPGANGAGSNFVSTRDGVYVAYGNQCARLDFLTGKKLETFKLPETEQGKPTRWGYLNVVDDYLIGGTDPLLDEKLAKQLEDLLKVTPTDDKPEAKEPADPKTKTETPKLKFSENDNLTASMGLVVMDRKSGKVLWKADAKSGFRHNGICIGGGRLYAIDRLSGPQIARLKRRGEEPKHAARLVAFDLQTGKELWTSETDVLGTFVSYSVEKDILVESGRGSRDTLIDEPKGMRAYQGATGKVVWFDAKAQGPAMIHGETILMAGSGCNLLTGKPTMRTDPLSGETVPWTWTRTYGCNTPMASEYLMTFRSGAAGYFDLCRDGGTGNWGGFRSSCTNNLVVAGGVLTAPDYTRTCTCSYQNQTSVGLIPTDDVEMWTYFPTQDRKEPIRRLGLNLGAPGDRKDENGTLWIDYPLVGGTSPRLTIKSLPAKPEVVRRHSSVIEENKLNWVGSSAITGLKSLTVNLTNNVEKTYTIRLYFAELEDVKAGQRYFDVTLQGQSVLKRFDVAKEAGGRNKIVMREFKGVKVKGDLMLTLTPGGSAAIKETILNGIEIVAEGW